jgi:hypothetical protein
MDTELSIFPTSEILGRWYLEYLDTSDSDLNYKEWYATMGKDRLLEYFVTKHDGVLAEINTRLSKRFAKGLTP